MTDFLGEITKAAVPRLMRDLLKLATERHKLRDITKPLGQGLFELTTSHDGMEYRCLYVFHEGDIVVLVCFVKKSRKTPPAKIELARSRYKELVRQEAVLGNVTFH